MSIKGKRVAFLGAGNMGEALIKGLTQTGLVPAKAISASDARADRLADIAKQYSIQHVKDNVALVRSADVVILAVKPQIMGTILKEIASVVDGSKLLISIAAGVARGPSWAIIPSTGLPGISRGTAKFMTMAKRKATQ